jgi:hypothetical protein
MIRVVHPGSRIPDPDANFLPIPDPGSRDQKGTGSRIGSATLVKPVSISKISIVGFYILAMVRRIKTIHNV